MFAYYMVGQLESRISYTAVTYTDAGYSIKVSAIMSCSLIVKLVLIYRSGVVTAIDETFKSKTSTTPSCWDHSAQ